MNEKTLDRCPKLYECTQIRMAPMIRALMRCSAEDAMESICANCPERRETQLAREWESVVLS